MGSCYVNAWRLTNDLYVWNGSGTYYDERKWNSFSKEYYYERYEVGEEEKSILEDELWFFGQKFSFPLWHDRGFYDEEVW